MGHEETTSALDRRVRNQAAGKPLFSMEDPLLLYLRVEQLE